jgi:hypothetical protein
MFENERSLVVGVTLVTKVVCAFIRAHEPRDVPVHIVATTAAHEAFPDRMVGGILHLRGDILMTLEAEFPFRHFE